MVVVVGNGAGPGGSSSRWIGLRAEKQQADETSVCCMSLFCVCRLSLSSMSFVCVCLFMCTSVQVFHFFVFEKAMRLLRQPGATALLVLYVRGDIDYFSRFFFFIPLRFCAWNHEYVSLVVSRIQPLTLVFIKAFVCFRGLSCMPGVCIWSRIFEVIRRRQELQRVSTIHVCIFMEYLLSHSSTQGGCSESRQLLRMCTYRMCLVFLSCVSNPSCCGRVSSDYVSLLFWFVHLPLCCTAVSLDQPAVLIYCR